jgi:hypothetical protein
MDMRVCYLDYHEAGMWCYLVIHTENQLRPLQLFYFHLWPFYWPSLVFTFHAFRQENFMVIILFNHDCIPSWAIQYWMVGWLWRKYWEEHGKNWSLPVLSYNHISRCTSKVHSDNKQVGSRCNSPYLCSGGTRMRSWTRYRVLWLKF